MSLLQQLQNSNEGVKRIVIIAGSVLSMAIVVFLWTHFAPPLIGSPDSAAQNNFPVVAQGNIPAQSAGKSGSFLANVASGAGYVWGRTSDIVQSGLHALTSPKSYTIQP